MKCRKLLAILLALVMVIGLLPFAALADGSQDNQLDYIQGTDPDPVGDPGIDPGVDPDIQPDTDLNIDPDGEPDGNLLGDPDQDLAPGVMLLNATHEGEEGWTALTNSTESWELDGGKYYLAENLELGKSQQGKSQQIIIKGNVTLCLNGQTLNSAVAKSTGAIKVETGATLTIRDCGSDGTITCSCTSGTPVIFIDGTCNLEKGTISDTNPTLGYAILVDTRASFTMSGGTLIGGQTGIFNRGTASISDGRITGTESGIANATNPAVFHISGGTFKGTGEDSSGICIDFGSLEMTGGTAIGKQAGVSLSTLYNELNEGIFLSISDGSMKGDRYDLYHESEYPLYLTGKPELSTLYLASTKNEVFVSNDDGGFYSGDSVAVSLGSGASEDAIVIKGVVQGNANNFTYAGEDFELAEDGKGNLILKTPTTAPGHHHTDDGSSVTWTLWDGTVKDNNGEKYLDSGYYYLENSLDIASIGKTINIKGDVHLCLNDQTLSGNTPRYGIFQINPDSSLTIYDCEGSGILQQNGRAEEAIYLTGGTFTLYGGTIDAGTSNYAVRVLVYNDPATLNIEGGCITSSNKSGIYGGTSGTANAYINVNGGRIEGASGIVEAGNKPNTEISVNGGEIVASSTGIQISKGKLIVNDGSISGATGLKTSITKDNGEIRILGGSITGTVDYGVLLSQISGVEDAYAPVYLSGSPTIEGTVADIDLADAKCRLYASYDGQEYSGKKLEISCDGHSLDDTVVYDTVNTDRFGVIEEDRYLVSDGTNLVLTNQPPTPPAAGHANHGIDGTDGNTVTWEPWNPATSPSKDGCYYLDKDYHSISSAINITADVHLCLNGHEMSDNGENAEFITVNRGASLTICDCSEDETGTINYKCTTEYAIKNYGALTLYSGKIYSTSGNGIRISSVGASNIKFDMEGGTIDVGGTGISFSAGNEVNIKDGTLIYGGQTGVLFAAEGTLTVSGRTIQPRENGDEESRGISKTGTGDLFVTGGNISGKENGIRVIGSKSGAVTISGGNISASGEQGYGIYLYETATANLYLSDAPTISGKMAALYIGKPNTVYAGKETAAYNGSALDIYFAGAAATENPIILNVTADKANLFNLNYPADKTLEHRADNHLYLADKILPMPKLTVTVEPSSLTYGQTAQATVSGEPSGASISYEIIESEPAGVASIGTDGAITTNGVGTFKVKVTVSATGYSDGEATSELVTINKATPNPTLPTNLTATYGDTLEDVNLPADWTWNAPTTSVGSKGTNEFEATYLDPSGYYNPVTKMLSVVVNAKTITDAVVVLGAYPTYDGTQKTQTITSVTVDGTVLIAGSDYTVTGNTGTEAKEYTLTITGTGNYSGTKEVTWYIQKAIPGVTAPTIRTLTYTGTAQALLNPGNTEQGTMVYSLQETEGYSVDIPKKTDAGTYDVWYKVLGYDGYQNTNPVKLQVTIKKAPLTVTADDIWVYAGNTPKFTATIKGYVNGEDGRVLKGELTFTCGYSQKYSKPGSRYTITPKGLTADNYDITFNTGTLTVKDPLSPRFNVYVLDSKHGTVEADCRYARKGDVVTLTIKPDWGYELETLTVTDSHGYELKLTYHSNGTYTFTMPRDNVTVKAIFTVRDMPFVDVPGDAWYAGGVRYVYAHGLMNGTGSWRFSPNRTTTRAMIATILYRMEGSPRVYGTSQFGDVEAGSWYEDAVIWATQNDIVEGYTSKTFGPNDPITREQMAAMLYRYADYCRCDMSAGRYVDLSKYSDMNEISDYAIPALRWAVGEEIIQGRTGKRLAPTDTATRAEVAVMLMRFCEEVIW